MWLSDLCCFILARVNKILSPGRRSVIEAHFDKLIRLLELETVAQARREADQARRFSGSEAERTGNSLVNLRVVDEEAGLGGRYILQLTKPRRAPLPWTRLDVGSPVLLSPDADAAKPQAASGFRRVICERDEHADSVTLTKLPEELGDVES